MDDRRRHSARYRRLRELLAEELGLAPSTELAALEGAILRQDDIPLLARATDGVSEGQLRSRISGPPTEGTLPTELTTFIPRPGELATVAQLFSSPGLVTLTGAGGTGKTRLALRAAREWEPKLDGAWLCELAALSDSSLVDNEIAASVGCREEPGVQILQSVAAKLAEGSQLLLIDNCEHVLAAAAEAAHKLRRAAPNLRVLATSRSPLGVAGELVFRVPSMSVPHDNLEPEGLLEYESVRLLVERARAHRPDFTVDRTNFKAIAAVCTRLDGIPLALELAAARLGTMSVADLEERLDHRFRLLTGGARTAPPRQRTLEASIDWSYDLLSDRERDVLGRALDVRRWVQSRRCRSGPQRR